VYEGNFVQKSQHAEQLWRLFQAAATKIRLMRGIFQHKAPSVFGAGELNCALKIMKSISSRFFNHFVEIKVLIY
jgi:hypothetical protein